MLAPNDALILSRYVDDARELETGRDYVVRLALPEDTQPAPFDLAKILAQLGKAYDAATAQNNVDWPDDPSQRDTNQHLIDFTFGQKRHEALRADADLDQSINDWLDKRDVHDGPQVQRPSFALWASLDPERRRRIDDALRQNVSKSADPAQAREPSAPSVTRSGSDGHLGRELLQSTMDVVPGAHYAKLARQAFDAGDPTAVAIYGAASLLDAFVGVATLGFGTEISSAVRTAVGAAQGALKGVLHGSAATLEKAAAIAASRIKRLPSGRFSIIDWKGYPEYLPRPAGPFRLIEGSEYKVARDVAHKVNRAMRNAEQSLQGKHVHEIHPVKFGGNPIDPANKVGLTPQQHYETSAWWFKLQRQMEKAK